MEQLTADVATFRALARSSRRLWRSVRIRVEERGATAGEGWRAWVRRPYAYRLEGLDGRLREAELERGSGSSSVVSLWEGEPQPDPAPEVAAIRAEALALVADLAQPDTPDEDLLAVALRAMEEATRRRDAHPALVAGRLLADPPTRRLEDGVPFFVNYQRMALLEPNELADGERATAVIGLSDGVAWESLTPREQEMRSAAEAREIAVAATEIARGDLARWDCPALDIVRVDHVDHHGRPALEAVVTTTSTYSPRCSCCALLAGRHSLGIERDGMGEEQARAIGWPDPAEGGVDFRVRLDVGTGICVEVEALDGSDAGGGFSATVEEVDADYPDALFTG